VSERLTVSGIFLVLADYICGDPLVLLSFLYYYEYTVHS